MLRTTLLRDLGKGRLLGRGVSRSNKERVGGGGDWHVIARLTRPEFWVLADLASGYGLRCWLVMDNTYEHFAGGSLYGGPEHACLEAPNLVNIFSFSKARALSLFQSSFFSRCPCRVLRRPFFLPGVLLA